MEEHQEVGYRTCLSPHRAARTISTQKSDHIIFLTKILQNPFLPRPPDPE